MLKIWITYLQVITCVEFGGGLRYVALIIRARVIWPEVQTVLVCDV